MAVYFVHRIDDPSRVKIGHSDDMERRLMALSTQFGPIVLLAVVEGGKDVEQTFHQMLSGSWVEGEWFAQSELLAALVDKFKGGVRGRRIWGRLRAVDGMSRSPIEEDREIARKLLKQIMDRLHANTFGKLLTEAHSILAQINPAWSHRRVRAIWNGEAARIDHFEVRDLNEAIQQFEALPGTQAQGLIAVGAEWVCPELKGDDHA